MRGDRGNGRRTTRAFAAEPVFERCACELFQGSRKSTRVEPTEIDRCNGKIEAPWGGECVKPTAPRGPRLPEPGGLEELLLERRPRRNHPGRCSLLLTEGAPGRSDKEALIPANRARTTRSGGVPDGNPGRMTASFDPLGDRGPLPASPASLGRRPLTRPARARAVPRPLPSGTATRSHRRAGLSTGLVGGVSPHRQRPRLMVSRGHVREAVHSDGPRACEGGTP